MWTVLMLKAIQSLPVDDLTSLESEDFADEAASSSIWAAMLTTLMQAVMVSLMSLMLLYAIAYVKSRALSRGTSHLVSEQRLFRLDQQHPVAMIRQTQPPHLQESSEDSSNKRRKIADMESIPLWQVPKVKSHRTNH
jgi:hypothetical protein